MGTCCFFKACHMIHLPYSCTILRQLIVIPILICLCFTGRAQTLQGNVYDAKSKTVLYPVTVVNLRTQQSSYSNEKGFFSIHAEAGDKVAFSYIGYEAKQYTMPVSVGTYSTDIAMEPISYRLNEIILTPDYTPYQHDSISRLRTYTPALSRRHASAFGSPFSFIAEKFNKKSKQTFKFQKNFVKWEKAQFVDSRYTPELVHDMTGLQGDSLGYFMSAYPMSYDYARLATELELKMWIRYNYRQWLKEIEQTGLPNVKDSLIQDLEGK